MKLQQYLKKINACEDAVQWVGDRNLQEAWGNCERGDWMLWLMQRAELCDLRKLTLAKAKCANLVRHLMKDKRSLKALNTAFAFAEGKATKGELAAAAAAAATAAAACVDAKTNTLKKCADICREILPEPKIKYQ